MTTLNSQLVQDVVAGVVFVGSLIVYTRGRIPQQTIKNLEESNKSYVELDKARQLSIQHLENRLTEIAKAHTDERLQLTKDIGDLQGQIKVYKELPLRELADGILQNNVISNKILDSLTTSAVVLVKDTADATVAAEQVKTTLVKDTQDVATAVERVKITLASDHKA